MKLNDYLKERRLTHQQLAELAGVDRSAVSHAAAGRCGYAAAFKLSRATNGVVSVGELLFPDGSPEGVRLSPSDPLSADGCSEVA